MYKRALSNLERTLFSPERALKLRSTLSKVRSALRAHSERIQSGYRADTDRIQSDGERRRTPGAPTGLERDLKSSERTPSGYRADTECKKSAGAEENCPTSISSLR